MRKKRFVALALAALALVALAAGGCGGERPSPAPTGTPAVTSAAPAVPTPSPSPTASPSPSPSPAPSPSPSPAPTASPTPSPTLAPTPTLTPTPAPAPAALTISIRYIEVADKYVDIKAAYPVVSGMADAAFQKKFNAAVRSDLKKKTDQFAADAKSDYDSSVADGREYVKFTLDSAVKVHLNDGAVLSLSVQIGEYAGGAHGTNDALYYTLANARPAKQFTLFKLFTKSSTAKSRIEKSIDAAIAKDPDSYLENPAYALSDGAWFYLTETKLHIVFPEVSIAPYAAGQPDFGIALSSFKDILVKGIPH